MAENFFVKFLTYLQSLLRRQYTEVACNVMKRQIQTVRLRLQEALALKLTKTTARQHTLLCSMQVSFQHAVLNTHFSIHVNMKMKTLSVRGWYEVAPPYTTIETNVFSLLMRAYLHQWTHSTLVTASIRAWVRALQTTATQEHVRIYPEQ